MYRGHSDSNYQCIPSINRTEDFKNKEHVFYHELLTKCPDEFTNINGHLDILSKMQHYGLPTRLLDITANPLIATFFAGEDNSEEIFDAELIINNITDSKKLM